jgi:hypothetical protein
MFPPNLPEAKYMSISFRNDFGPSELRVVNGTHPDPRPIDAPPFVQPAPQVPLVGSHDVRATDFRSPDFRSPDFRNTDFRAAEPRSIDVRLTEIKNGATARDLPDVKMDQIRELLFGEVQRLSEQRITTLETKVRELETALHHRLDAMQARIDALAAETRGDRRSTLDELARGISDLGDRVKRIPG